MGIPMSTHWGRVMHICVGKLAIIGSGNGLSPDRHQAIIRTNAGILLIETLRTNFSGILTKIHTFSFKKIRLKMSAGKCRPLCLGLNVVRQPSYCFQNLDLTKYKMLHDGPLTWRINRTKQIDLHVLLLEDILVLLQKQDERLVLKCQSMQVAPGKEETKVAHVPIIKLTKLLPRQVATGMLKERGRWEGGNYVEGEGNMGGWKLHGGRGEYGRVEIMWRERGIWEGQNYMEGGIWEGRNYVEGEGNLGGSKLRAGKGEYGRVEITWWERGICEGGIM